MAEAVEACMSGGAQNVRIDLNENVRITFFHLVRKRKSVHFLLCAKISCINLWSAKVQIQRFFNMCEKNRLCLFLLENYTCKTVCYKLYF